MTYFKVQVYRTFIINAKNEAEAVALGKGRVRDNPWNLFAKCMMEGE
jgi:hypothetical protein